MDYKPEMIKKIRKEKGLTQKQLGEKCGMKEPQLRKYETGNGNPKLETIKRIADALEEPVHIFLEGDLKTEYLREIFAPEEEYTSEEATEEGEDTLISNYQRLNPIGKEEAQKRVSELTEIQRYTEKEK